MQRFSLLLPGLVAGWLAGCYYSPEVRRDKADPSFMSESQAQALIAKKLGPYGISFIFNVKMLREEVKFVADGYDRNVRIGFEYRSHEDGDFKGEEDQSPDGLSDDDITALQDRQAAFREYFLIVPEGTREDVEATVEKFVEDLYAWEVLKKVKPKEESKDQLFPESDKEKEKDLLPWEATGDIKKKRQELEERGAGNRVTKDEEFGSDPSNEETESKESKDSKDSEPSTKSTEDERKDDETKDRKEDKDEDEAKDEAKDEDF